MDPEILKRIWWNRINIERFESICVYAANGTARLLLLPPYACTCQGTSPHLFFPAGASPWTASLPTLVLPLSSACSQPPLLDELYKRILWTNHAHSGGTAYSSAGPIVPLGRERPGLTGRPLTYCTLPTPAWAAIIQAHVRRQSRVCKSWVCPLGYLVQAVPIWS